MGIAGGMMAEDGAEAINRRVNKTVIALWAEVRQNMAKVTPAISGMLNSWRLWTSLRM